MKPFRLAGHQIVVVTSNSFLLIAWIFANIYGIAYTNDSVHFAAAGRSFWQSGQWLTADGQALAHWQPLYPTLLGIFLNIPSGVFILHLVCLLAFMRGLWLLKRSLHLPGWAYAAILCHPLVLTAFSFVWIEALALPLLLWFLWYYIRFRNAPFKQRLPAFFLIVAISWCRFAFLPAIYTLLLRDGLAASAKKERYFAGQLFIASLLAVTLWIGYAYMHQSDMLHNYGMWEGNWRQTFIFYLYAWGNYFLPATAQMLLPVVAFCSMILLSRSFLRASPPQARYFLTAAGVELLFLLLVNIQSYDDQVRYLLPVWVFCLLGMGALPLMHTQTAKTVFIVWWLSLLVRDGHHAMRWHETRRPPVATVQLPTHIHETALVPKANAHKKWCFYPAPRQTGCVPLNG
jgi:hypothetical protein